MKLHQRLSMTVSALSCATVICIGTAAVASNTMRDDSFDYATANLAANGWTVGSGTTAVIAGGTGVGGSRGVVENVDQRALAVEPHGGNLGDGDGQTIGLGQAGSWFRLL